MESGKYIWEYGGLKFRAYYDDGLNGLVLLQPDGGGNIKEMYIPKAIDGIAVKDVMFDEFLGGYDRFVVDTDNEYLSTADGVLFDRGGTVLISYPNEKRDEIYKIPEGVKAIHDSAFWNKYLKHVILPDGLEVIVQYAFAVCKNLEEITIPKSLRKVYLKAFYGCSAVKTVYYKGSKDEWNEIDFTDFNEALTKAQVIFNHKDGV